MTGDNRILDLSYSYDLDSGPGVMNNGSVASVTNNRDSNRTQSYTYDQLSRLATAEVPATAPNPWKQVFEYDVWANLKKITIARGSAPALDLTISNINRITNTGFSYDTAGNLTADGSYSYTYDAASRMATAAAVTYTRDGDDRRAKKSNGTLYWYCEPCGTVLAETDLSGVFKREYIHFNGQRVARHDSGGNWYLFADHLGSLRAMTWSNGSIVQEMDYYAYGQAIYVASNPTWNDSHLFTGAEFDSESSLSYFQYRMLSSNIGRWSAPDPVMASPNEPQSLNRYNYANNNPMNQIDQCGLWPEDPTGGGCASGFCGGCSFVGTCGGPDPCAALVGADRVLCHIANFYQPDPFAPGGLIPSVAVCECKLTVGIFCRAPIGCAYYCSSFDCSDFQERFIWMPSSGKKRFELCPLNSVFRCTGPRCVRVHPRGACAN